MLNRPKNELIFIEMKSLDENLQLAYKRYNTVALLLFISSLILFVMGLVGCSTDKQQAPSQPSTTYSLPLIWTPSDDNDYFTLYYGTNSRDYNQTMHSQLFYCTVSNLTLGVTYYFAVTGHIGTNESDYSNELIYKK